ncbi:hypothetical protein HMPREF0591_1411 [Mycobacterium parascrofulaceum ATCC BAA-614]|uniref:ATP synthase F0, A subunit n=1 Tax=Mycobacterium parascrofulaceum ATCC BAA-614 TaxID=525368 RepID=D5P5G7_9MYCO|nr:hypothetical protein [Mycobacterium parascrofulaceum]EFG78680.1 hypothetical protein HMPREF0591_1411 [Mycobacterium parascrofulaceum ATCC BAA-614]
MLGRTQYWLLCHPRVRRPVKVLALLQALATIAVALAPGASAATNAAVLNWTGLHDNYGVPIGDFYLSLASIPDQITQGGPDAQAWDPTSWGPWVVHTLEVMSTGFAASTVLTAEAGAFIGIIALSLWVMKLTISTYWLLVFGQLAKAVTAAVITVTSRWGLVALTVPAGVFLGVLAVRRGEAGRGWTMILLAIMMPALALTVFSDPAGMMYGPNGLLAFGRSMGFSTAEAVTHNGAIGGGGFTGQVDTLTSSLITHAGREPLEVFNFGHVIDTKPGCAAQYTAALQQGVADGPIKAMARCGDFNAVHYAQNLDATNTFGGAVLVLAAILFGWFMISAGASVFTVSVKAMYTTAKLLPSVFAGGISGAAQEHAKATVWRFFKHPIEVMVFVTFVSVMGLAIERLISRPLPRELGGSNPFAHVLIMAGGSMAALYLLRHIRADLQGHHPGRGLLGRASDVAMGLAMHAGLRGAGSAALSGLRGQHGSGKTPWEQLEERSASDPQTVLGPPQDGFSAVPGAAAAHSDRADSSPAPTDPHGAASPTAIPQPISAPHSSGDGINQVIDQATATIQRPGRRQRQPRAAQANAPGRMVLDSDWPSSAHSAEAQPITAASSTRPSTGWEDAPPLSAYADHTSTDVPLPPPPPPEDPSAPPPPDDASPAASVDPITGP